MKKYGHDMFDNCVFPPEWFKWWRCSSTGKNPFCWTGGCWPKLPPPSENVPRLAWKMSHLGKKEKNVYLKKHSLKNQRTACHCYRTGGCIFNTMWVWIRHSAVHWNALFLGELEPPHFAMVTENNGDKWRTMVLNMDAVTWLLHLLLNDIF